MSGHFTTPSQLYCTLAPEETAERLHTSLKTGIKSHGDATFLRSIHGPNDLITHEEENIAKKFLKGFIEQPMNLLLLGSASVSMLMGNWDDAISISVALLIVVTVGFIQEYKSEKSLEMLSTLVPPNAHLTRGGKSSTVLASELVPGDLVSFDVGDRIPADLRLITAIDLDIDESNLTGEGDPVRKDIKSCSGGSIPERKCIGFMGTLVVHGRGSGIVVGIGSNTEFGSIFSIMSSIDKPKTPLQMSMDKLSKDLSFLSFLVIALICLIGIVQGRKWLDMFTIGVSLAVAAIPEGLPIIVTVTLALGVLRMANQKAIVRRLPSVETLGCVSVVCSDKTGTLTLNKMSICSIWAPDFDKAVLADDLSGFQPFEQLIVAGALCNNTRVAEDGRVLGHPTDVALMEMYHRFDSQDPREGKQRSAEVPFSSKRKWMGVTVDGQSYLKGAQEMLTPRCAYYVTKDGTTKSFDDGAKSRTQYTVNQLSEKGLRVLAIATCKGTISEDASDLTFLGLVAMKDPLRPGVSEAIATLVAGRVKMIMITGDSEATALSIGKSLNMPMLTVMNGDDVDRMNTRDLESCMSRTAIFARTSPEHKMKIIKALQGRGDVVAMTGDGVNDAPALKMADIGVAMGVKGTDVAKEAADMVLTDDDFSTILGAIEEGKGIFFNIQNFITLQLSTSIAALSLVMVATLLGLENPLNAMQILWINILMDGPPAQSLGVEPVDPDVMKRPPRAKHSPILTRKVFYRVLGSACIIMFGTMSVFVFELQDGGVTARDTTMTFTCFVLFDMFNALSCRNASKSVFEIGIFSNHMFNLSVGCSILGQLAVIYVPFFQSIFQTEALAFTDLLALIIIASSVLIADEARKYYQRTHRKGSMDGYANGV